MADVVVPSSIEIVPPSVFDKRILPVASSTDADVELKPLNPALIAATNSLTSVAALRSIVIPLILAVEAFAIVPPARSSSTKIELLPVATTPVSAVLALIAAILSVAAILLVV